MIPDVYALLCALLWLVQSDSLVCPFTRQSKLKSLSIKPKVPKLKCVRKNSDGHPFISKTYLVLFIGPHMTGMLYPCKVLSTANTHSKDLLLSCITVFDQPQSLEHSYRASSQVIINAADFWISWNESNFLWEHFGNDSVVPLSANSLKFVIHPCSFPTDSMML